MNGNGQVIQPSTPIGLFVNATAARLLRALGPQAITAAEVDAMRSGEWEFTFGLLPDGTGLLGIRPKRLVELPSTIPLPPPARGA